MGGRAGGGEGGKGKGGWECRCCMQFAVAVSERGRWGIEERGFWHWHWHCFVLFLGGFCFFWLGKGEGVGEAMALWGL